MSTTLPETAAELARIAFEAGLILLKHYAEPADVRLKEDSSPVTAADEEAEAFILARLAELAPQHPVIAEEAMAQGRRAAVADTFFLVDPLDGTKEFLRRNGEFTVNIALVRRGVPVAGVVHAPALARLFLGAGDAGAYEIPAANHEPFELKRAHRICARHAPKAGLTVAISRTHGDSRTEEYLRSYDIARLVTAGSSLKFGLIAAGEVDLYPRHGPTMEWDTAAGHAVVAAAGGRVTTIDEKPLLYGKEKDGFRNPPFLARGAA